MRRYNPPHLERPEDGGNERGLRLSLEQLVSFGGFRSQNLLDRRGGDAVDFSEVVRRQRQLQRKMKGGGGVLISMHGRSRQGWGGGLIPLGLYTGVWGQDTWNSYCGAVSTEVKTVKWGNVRRDERKLGRRK